MDQELECLKKKLQFTLFSERHLKMLIPAGAPCWQYLVLHLALP